jgi:hypothetical protein
VTRRAAPPSLKQLALVAGLSALLGAVAGLVWLALLKVRPETLPTPAAEERPP